MKQYNVTGMSCAACVARVEKAVNAGAAYAISNLATAEGYDDNYELVSEDSLAMSAGTYTHPSRKTPFDERSKEFDTKKELAKEKRERKRQELRFGRPKGDR